MRADSFVQPTRFMPDFEIEQTADRFVFKAELLGIKENEVDIAVCGDLLTISGHLYDPRACAYAGFRRAFTLPETRKGDQQIHAALDAGVLTVTLTGLPCDDALERWESDGGVAR